MSDEVRAGIDAADRAAEDAGGTGTPGGREALMDAVDLRLRAARADLEFGDDSTAAALATEALERLGALAEVAAGVAGGPAHRLDANQLLCTVHLRRGDAGPATDHARRAAAEAYAVRPDSRAANVAAPLLWRQLRDLWRWSADPREGARLRTAMREVRVVMDRVEALVAGASRGVSAVTGLAAVDPFVVAAGDFADGLAGTAIGSGPSAEAGPEVVPLSQRAAGAEQDYRVAVEPAAAAEAALRAVRLMVRAGQATPAAELGLEALGDLPYEWSGARTAQLRGAVGHALVEADDVAGGWPLLEAAWADLSAIGDEVGAEAHDRLAAVQVVCQLAFVRRLLGDVEGSQDAIDEARRLSLDLIRDHGASSAARTAVTATITAILGDTAHGPAGWEVMADLVAAVLPSLEILWQVSPDDEQVLATLRFATEFGLVAGGAGPGGTIDPDLLQRWQALLEETGRLDPGSVWTDAVRAESLAFEGGLARRAGRTDTGLRFMESSVRLYRDLVARFPDEVRLRTLLGTAAEGLAVTAAQGRDRARAMRAAKVAVAAARERVALQPAVTDARTDLIKRLEHVAVVARLVGDERRAREWTAEALEERRRLHLDDPDDAERLHDLVRALVASTLPRPAAGAQPELEEAVQFVERLQELDPLHPRLPRTAFETLLAATIEARLQDDQVAALRYASAALSYPDGATEVPHHHGHAEHADGSNASARELLIEMVGTLLADPEVEAEAGDVERARSVLARVQHLVSAADPSDGVASDAMEEHDPEVVAALTIVRPREVRTLEPVPPGQPSDVIRAANAGSPKLHFGLGLSGTPDLMVIGAPGDTSREHHVLVNGDADDDGGRPRGAAHVYRRLGQGWLHEAYLKPHLPLTSLWFGWSVAAEDDTVVVGAPGALPLVEDEEPPLPGERVHGTGAVWVFEYDADGWRPGAYLPSDREESGSFGHAVALDGTILAVGDPKGFGGAGRVDVFLREDEEDWSKVMTLVSPLPKAPGPDVMGFGYSVAMNWPTLVVGEWQHAAPSDDGSGQQIPAAGAAWVFDLSDEEAPPTLLLAPTADGPANHGLSVDVRGDLIAVGAPTGGRDPEQPESRSGLVSVYRRGEDGGWDAVGLKVTHPHGQDFGSQVRILPDGRIAVSAAVDAHGRHWRTCPSGDAGSGPRYGAVHVLEEGPDGWRISDTLTASEPGQGDEFGLRMTVAGDALVIGAPNDSTSGRGINPPERARDTAESGAVHVVRLGTR